MTLLTSASATPETDPTPAPGHRRRRRLRRGTAVAAVLVVGAAAGAFAYWTSTGTGSGSATTAESSPITINQSGPVTGLAPGAAAQSLSGDFTNTTNDGASVYITSVVVTIDSVTKASGAPSGTCDASDYTLTGATMSVGADVPAGTGVGSWSGATIRFNNKAPNQDACKGATVNLAYAAS